MRKTVFVLLIFVFLLTAVGCGVRQSATSNVSLSEERSYSINGVFFDAKASTTHALTAEESGFAEDAVQQRIIRNAELSLDVENLDVALEELERLIKQSTGFVANSSVSGRGENRTAWLTIRVPEARLDSFLIEGKELGKVLHTNIYTNEVTLQYIDLEARISNLERQEERLLSILDKAENIEDILRIEQELGRIRGQLETLTGEFRYLRNQVEYSTVSMTLRETPTASPVITGSGLKGVWQRGTAGLVNTVNAMLTGLGNLLVFLLTFLPLFALLAAIAAAAAYIGKKTGRGGPRTPDAE